LQLNQSASVVAVANCNMLFCVYLNLDANIVVDEDQCGRFVHEAADRNADQCFSAHMHVTNQCELEDDLDDIIAFPVFSKRSSRRLRRTSIEIYRKSLHDAESVASEEECDANPVAIDTESDVAAVDVEMHSANDDVFCIDVAPPVTESNYSPMSPTVDIERMEVQSDVNTVKLPSSSVINSNSAVQSKTGILFM